MKKILYFVLLILINEYLFAETIKKDTVKLSEVIITANRMPVILQKNPGSVSLVNSLTLETMPKTIGAEEAMRLVPGVRIDNQHNGERIHLSIRGQGILTERGLRGIGIMLDGIPLNDPSGFVPDLYDVDWATVSKIEVLRGPLAGLYDSSGAGGTINITTNNGEDKAIGGSFRQNVGSYGFYKTFAQIGGKTEPIDYRFTFSRTGSKGYRDHQGFWSNKLYEKLNFQPGDNLLLTQIVSHTDYFQQNPEGLNISQLDNPRQANPDAGPYNEYQKTNRTTLGLKGNYLFNSNHNLQFYSYYRSWRYKETSNKCAEYRDYGDPGFGLQYNLNFKAGKTLHLFGIGSDLKWQNIDMYKLKSAPLPGKQRSLDETNIETDTLLANQIIKQNSAGLFAYYRFRSGKINFIVNIRHDLINNELNDKMLSIDTAKTEMDFTNTSVRLGVGYDLLNEMTIFVNFGQGFIPPSTEELSANPLGYSGFNTHLIPATANSIEAGARGSVFNRIFYDITAFWMNTENDFFRFKQSGRGNQEVFYGNAGNSRRLGIESYFSIDIMKNLNLQLAYTYSDFRYTSATIDTVYTDTNYVLTSPPEEGQYLPNSPKHQLYVELRYSLNKHFLINIGSEYQSKWAIYTDAKAYNGELDPKVYRNWQEGFNLFNAGITYLWKIKSIEGKINFSARNFTGADYMAFTEPDPDGNSYHPGPKQEFFAGIIVEF
jgi:iron complex outermembrane receptor protein